MEAKTDCDGLSEHPLEYTMLPDAEYNWPFHIQDNQDKIYTFGNAQ